MAGAGAAEDSEPLFVLEPLPELSNVIDSFFGANLFALSGGLILMAYFIIKFEDHTKIMDSSINKCTTKLLHHRFTILFDDFYQRTSFSIRNGVGCN